MTFVYLLVVVGAVLIVAAGYGMVKLLSSKNPADKHTLGVLRNVVSNQNKRLRVAETALRRIAGDNSGDPALDAQLALSEMDDLEERELTV